MPGTWAATTVLNAENLGTTVGAQQHSRNLPTSNFIGRLTFKLEVVGTDTSTVTLDFVRVIAAGNAVIWSTEGGQLRGVNKYQNGSVTNGAAVGATNQVWVGTINFGRGFHDELMVLPAKLYKQLQLQLTMTTATAGVTAIRLTIVADEYFSNDDPRSKLVRTCGLVQTVTAAASLRSRVQMNRGRFLRAVYVHFDDPDNVGSNTAVYGGTVATPENLRVLINNGAEVPFEESADMVKISNQETYRFDDADTPDTELTNAAVFTGTEEMVCLDFDPTDDLAHAVDTSKVNDISVEFVAAASGTSGVTHIIADEFYPVVF